jgi:hypothetical protein
MKGFQIPHWKDNILSFLNQKVFYPTLKKHGFFHGNIVYIYERASNLTLKKYYVNQNGFYPTLKKHGFFHGNIVYIH